MERYVQEAALTVPAQPLTSPKTSLAMAPATPRPTPSEAPAKRPRLHDKDISEMKSRIDELGAKLQALNIPPPYVKGRKVHLADQREMMANPADWSTKCGWRYGLVKFLRVNKNEPRAKSVFPTQQ